MHNKTKKKKKKKKKKNDIRDIRTYVCSGYYVVGHKNIIARNTNVEYRTIKERHVYLVVPFLSSR